MLLTESICMTFNLDGICLILFQLIFIPVAILDKVQKHLIVVAWHP